MDVQCVTRFTDGNFLEHIHLSLRNYYPLLHHNYPHHHNYRHHLYHLSIMK